MYLFIARLRSYGGRAGERNMYVMAYSVGLERLFDTARRRASEAAVAAGAGAG
jgi:hypothetical protein